MSCHVKVGLVNKTQEHFCQIKEFLEIQGLPLIIDINDIQQGDALAAISDGRPDLYVVIAREYKPDRYEQNHIETKYGIKLVSSITHREEEEEWNHGEHFVAVDLDETKSRILRYEMIRSKGPNSTNYLRIERQLVYRIPNVVEGQYSVFNDAVRTLRETPELLPLVSFTQ